MAIDIVPKEEVLASDYGRTPSILYVDGNRAGETYTQDGSQFRPFRTITAANAAAGAGDTIVVAPQTSGPYTEALITLPSDVSLEGIAGNYTYINGDVTMGAGPCSIKYIAFTGATNILTVNGGTTMRDVYNYGQMLLPLATSKVQAWNCHVNAVGKHAVVLSNANAEFYSVMGKIATTGAFNAILSSGKVILEICEVSGSSNAEDVINSTGGYLRLFHSSVVNGDSRLAILANNGAGAPAPNVLHGVIAVSTGGVTINMGASVTLYDNVTASTTVSGSGIVKGAATDGAVMEVDYTAQTVLAAVTSGSPTPITMNASTILARLAAGDVKACSVAEMQTLLGITPEHYADFTGEQAVLVDAPIRTWIAPGTGNLVSIYARVAVTHDGAGHNEHSDVQINKNGVSVLNGGTPILIGLAQGILAVPGVLSAVPGVVDFVAGDVFTIVEDYTLDGGGGDSGANLAVVVEYLLD